MSDCNTDTEPMLGNRTFEELQALLPSEMDLTVPWNEFSTIVEEDDDVTTQCQEQLVDDPLQLDGSAYGGGRLPRRTSSDLSALYPMAVDDDVTTAAQVAPPPPPPAQRCDSGSELAPDAIPARDNWPGAFNFQTTVRSVTVASGRQLPYVFSGHSGKLYTDVNVAVPFSFQLQGAPPAQGLRIRALPVYKETHHAHTPVRRCPTHREASHPSNQGETELLHVVRAEHPKAKYTMSGEWRAVTVPFERPGPGLDDYTVLYKFTCMNTCVGGINRRRLAIVFTLEERSSNTVVGRQSVEVKVCRCPHRDWRTDEKKRTSDSPQPASKRRREGGSGSAPRRGLPAAGPHTFQCDSAAEYEYLLDCRETFRRMQQRGHLSAAAVVASDERPPPAPAPISRQPTTPVKAEFFTDM